MASGTLTLSTQSVDYGGGRGAVSMTNTINWSTNGNTLTLSNGGRSGGDYWSLYNSTGASDYLVVLKVQVNYGSGWTTISEQSAYIGTVAQGGLRIDTKSEEFLNNLGSYTLTGNCSLRALYYATYAPVPTPDYPNAFPDENYSEASQTPVVVDVIIAPDTPTITNVSSTYNSITCDWGTTSFGTPSTGEVALYCNKSGSFSPLNTKFLTKTTTGLSTGTVTQYNTGAFSTKEGLVPNSRYYLFARADNGSATSLSLAGSASVLAEPASVGVGTVTENSIEVNYSTNVDGGLYDKEIQYSLDGGNTWVTGITVSGGSAQSGSFIISNLIPSTRYSIQTRVHTTAGNSVGTTLSATTSSLKYKLYGPVPITVYKVTALTKNSGFNATTFMSKWENVKGVMLYSPAILMATAVSGNMTEARVRLDRGGGSFDTMTIFSYTTGAYNNEGAEWGFASEPQNGYFTSIQETQTLSELLIKVYASVSGLSKSLKVYGSKNTNNLAKLIHKK